MRYAHPSLKSGQVDSKLAWLIERAIIAEWLSQRHYGHPSLFLALWGVGGLRTDV